MQVPNFGAKFDQLYPAGFETGFPEQWHLKIVITKLRGSYRANDEVITWENEGSPNQYLETS